MYENERSNFTFICSYKVSLTLFILNSFFLFEPKINLPQLFKHIFYLKHIKFSHYQINLNEKIIEKNIKLLNKQKLSY